MNTIINPSVEIFSGNIAAAKKIKYKLILVFIICFLSGSFGGMVSTIMSVYLPLAVKDLLGNVSAEKLNEVSAYISSIFIFGWMFGGIVWGLLADKIGRKKAIVAATAFYALFTVLTSFSSSWLLVVVCRFLSGFGVGGVLVTTCILIAEIWPAKNKVIALGILSIAFPVGIFSAGLINYLVPAWRQAFLIGIIPAAIAVFSYWVLPESHTWINRKQLMQATGVDAQKLFTSENKKSIRLGAVIFGCMLIGLWAVFSWLPTWVQSICSETDAQKQRGISMMLMGAGGLIGGFFSGWLTKAFGGLRNTMLLCFGACFILTFILFKTNTSFSSFIYPEIALLALFFGISQGTLAAFIPALFSVNIRASATGFCFNVGRLFTGTAVFFIGALVSFAGSYGNAIFIFSFTFLVGFAAMLLLRNDLSLKNY